MTVERLAVLRTPVPDARPRRGYPRHLRKRYCGRDFTEAELEAIRQQIAQSAAFTRADLSRLTCRQLSWFKLDGGLKETSCRVAMLRMQEMA